MRTLSDIEIQIINSNRTAKATDRYLDSVGNVWAGNGLGRLFISLKATEVTMSDQSNVQVGLDSIKNGVISGIAGETLNGQIVVTLKSDNKFYKFSNTDEEGYFRAIGISVGAADAGSSVSVATTGEFYSDVFNLETGAMYFAGVNGQLSKTFPTPGLRVPVGIATSNKKIFINFHEPIITIS